MAAETANAIICLVPARVETRWWHTLAKHMVWCAIGGRLKFYDEHGQRHRTAHHFRALLFCCTTKSFCLSSSAVSSRWAWSMFNTVCERSS